MVVQISVLFVFAVVMVGIAFYSRKKSATLGDFFLGGRNMGAWLSAFAYGTTYFSAVIMIGYAGRNGWNFGLASTWIGIGNAVIGSLLAWMVLAKRTRRMTRHLNAATTPEFFEKRFQSRNMKIVSAIIIFVFLVPYSASVYQGLSYLFEMSIGIPFVYCMVGMAALTAVYLVSGGYIATALTDVVQGVIMVVGIVLIVFHILTSDQVGGLSQGMARLSQIEPGLAGPVGPATTGGVWPLLSLVLLTSLGTWGLPQMLHKFYAIRDEKAVKNATVISTVFALIIAGGAYFMGGFARLFMDGIPIDPVTGVANADLIMPIVFQASKLPDILMGVLLVSVLSASMSTLSSLVLTSSSAIAMDLVQGTLFPKMSQKKVLLVMRSFCALFVAVSVWIAMNRQAGIQTLMTFSWGTISGSFLAPFLFGLYWKRTTRAGAWAGLLSGVGTSLVLTTVFNMGPAQSPIIGVAAMGVSLVLTPLVSLFTKPLPQAHIDYVFEEHQVLQQGSKAA